MGNSDACPEVRALWQRVAAERTRAARAASLASKYEARLALPPESLWPLWSRLTDLHRRIEQRHVATARLIELHATRMERLDDTDGPVLRPAFIATVASSLGMPSAMATLYSARHTSAVVAASDATARAAHELEAVMAEGPAIEAAATGTSVAVAGSTLLDRWPLYGSAVAELGVRAVTAAPLGSPRTCLGALCAYGAEPVIPAGVALATYRMAGALTEMILWEARTSRSSREGAVPRMFNEADYGAVVHQAAGMVSVQCDCAVDAAEDLLVARAFAVGVPVEQIALQVVRGEITLRI